MLFQGYSELDCDFVKVGGLVSGTSDVLHLTQNVQHFQFVETVKY